MALFSGGGKGNSSAATTQTANNEQVATQSGIAIGAKAEGNTINVSSSDPEVAKYALGSSLSFAGHAADVAGAVNESAISGLKGVAELSISSGNDLAKKFLSSVSDTAAQNINLLQSVGQNETEVALNAQRSSAAALQSSFDVSKSVAPQDPSYALQTTLSKTAYIIVAVVVAGFLGLFLLRKRA